VRHTHPSKFVTFVKLTDANRSASICVKLYISFFECTGLCLPDGQFARIEDEVSKRMPDYRDILQSFSWLRLDRNSRKQGTIYDMLAAVCPVKSLAIALPVGGLTPDAEMASARERG
jgi:hypothetical protein